MISKWKKDLEHPGLCSAVSKHICECAKAGMRLLFIQDRKWFFSFIQDPKRFHAHDDAMIENNWFPTFHQKTNDILIEMIQETLKKNKQRPLLGKDLEQINYLLKPQCLLKLPSNHHANQLMLLEHKEKWDFEQVMATWKACITQKLIAISFSV